MFGARGSERGARGAADIALFAASNEAILRGVLKLDNGVPSHDTSSRLFRQRDPERFGPAFSWSMTSLFEACTGVVTIEGEVLGRSFDRASGRTPQYRVSA